MGDLKTIKTLSPWCDQGEDNGHEGEQGNDDGYKGEEDTDVGHEGEDNDDGHKVEGDDAQR